MNIVVKNGRVIDPATQTDRIADVLIVEGKVAGVAPNLSSAGARVVEASGLIVAPGFIDMHVHLREPGFEHAETIESGSRAAAAGGFTSICCMPNTKPINDSATVTSYIVERARRKAVVNVFPIGAITKGSAGEELAAIGAMKAAGAVAISDDGLPVMNSRVMRRAMEFARSYDLPVIDHCEDLNLSAGGDMHEGASSVRWGLRGIPAAAEDIMVARDLLLAQLTGARYHVAHLSTRNAAAMVAHARRQGILATCEATPHHFALCDQDMAPYDSNYKMKPPLRSCGDRSAVLDAIAAGTVDAIATDHAPHPGSEKMQEFERCPFGVIGLETALALALEELVTPGRITLNRMVEMFTTGPESVMRLGRGSLAPGSSGDVTVFSTDLKWTYDVNQSFSASRNSPFHNRAFTGGPVATIVNGEVVWSREV
ncbi:MAG TPA: dihydroorotase [Verrucomicrobiae bacterium]|nr:dihydroorotase [Verrucomicrobiae bacterium]